MPYICKLHDWLRAISPYQNKYHAKYHTLTSIQLSEQRVQAHTINRNIAPTKFKLYSAVRDLVTQYTVQNGNKVHGTLLQMLPATEGSYYGYTEHPKCGFCDEALGAQYQGS